MNLLAAIPPFPQVISLRELAEATGLAVALLRTEAQRLHGDGALELLAVGAEWCVRRQPTATLLTTAEAAERLGISRRRVLALIRAGRLDAQKTGRDWLLYEAALAAVADRRPGRPRKSA